MVKIHRYPQGSRVRVRRGRYPLDPSLEGREGLVLRLYRKSGDRYAVQLDGESELRAFDESELDLISAGASIHERGAYHGGNASDQSS